MSSRVSTRVGAFDKQGIDPGKDKFRGHFRVRFPERFRGGVAGSHFAFACSLFMPI